MQSITVIALGKINADYYAKAAAEYTKRLSTLCKLQVIELSEESISEKSASPAAVQKALEKEGKAILAAVPKGACIVALCIEGKQKSSEELASFFAEKANSGAGDIAFVIGSSHGIAQEIKAAAREKMSMSKMTFPHQLARVMLLEQIYRAYTITSGIKYHK